MKRLELGPGLLLAATGIGVGDMVSSTIAGAEYGLTLVWALAAGVVIKFAITEGVARWQLATDATMVEGWRDHLPSAALLVVFLYFVVWSYFVSSALVAASALVPAAVMPGVPLFVWGILHAAAALLMIVAGRYDRFLAVVKAFIALMFAALLAAVAMILFWSGADWHAVAGRSEFSTAYALSVIGGVGGTVTLLSYGYWMREAGWRGPGRTGTVRVDLSLSFGLVFLFSAAMTFLSTQVDWSGQVLDEGPRLCLLLADRIGREIGPVGRAVFLVGFWGAAYSSVLGVWHGVPFLFDDAIHRWRRRPPTGQRGVAYRSWAVYLTLASISSLALGRPVWIVFAYTIVGALFFPFVVGILLWLNNSVRVRGVAPPGLILNGVLVAALVLYLYLAARAIFG